MNDQPSFSRRLVLPPPEEEITVVIPRDPIDRRRYARRASDRHFTTIAFGAALVTGCAFGFSLALVLLLVLA